MVEHKNVIRLVKSAKYIDLNEDSVFLQTGSLAFDASTLEIWGPGLNGGILHLESNEVFLDYQKLKEAIISKEVNTMWLTAALYNQLISMDSCMFDKLTHLLVGGEKLSEKHIAMLHDKNKTIRLTNGYGPTECTTFTTTYDIPADCKTLPIGRPITNTQIYILNGDKLCGIGIPGELCVAGDGVARGYLNHPELTAEKFVKNPFGEGNLYRSGDLARWMSDGNIEFLGRIDEQVKVRGFRIELGEIENAIKSIESIKDCAVIAREETSGDKAIYAYVVSEEEMGVPAIRDILGKTLPEYMIPAYMAQIEMIPVTRNGKLDRKALPEIEAKAEKEYVAPGTEIEEKICCIFGEILGIEKVGVKDNFFESGGHSLRATRLVNRIESETGVRITLKEVFKNQTVESLAELVTGKEAKTYTPIPKAEEKEYYAMSSVQKRIYLTQQMDLGSITYNMPGHIKIQGEIDPVHIRQVLQDMIDRHEIFRTEFIIINGEPVQKICNTVEADFEYFDDPVTPEEIIMDRFVKPFDLGKSPLIRMMLVKRQNYNLLLVDTHHIISDGMSMDIFTREISSLYNGRKLKELTHQYKDYSEWMRSRDISSQRDFWMQEFCDEVPVLDIPLDFVRPQKQSFKGSFVAKRIGKELSSRIKKLAKDTEATEFMVFLSAVMVLLSKYSRQNDIAVGSVMSSRTHKDTTEILGMFANTLVLRGQPEGHKTFTGFLGEMRDKCFKVYENQEYPFEELVENLAIQRDLSRNPLFDVMLGFQNNEKKDMDIKGASLQYSEYKSAIAKFDLSFDICWTTDLEYEIELEYCSDLFIQDTASRMLSHLISILSQLTDNPLIQLSKVAAITHVEKEKILGAFNRTQVTYPKQKTVAQLFEEQVVKQANKTAVVMEDQELSYKELNQKANVLALQLRDLGVKPNDCVAIMAKKSLEIIIGLCGIVKSGAAYVPIDMNYPKERIQFILNDCKPKALLVFGEEFETDIPCIDVTTACASAAKDCNPERINRQEDLAYIIYTSGTTGQPKGVMIEQKSIIKLVINCDYTPLDETVSILQVGQISFDASTFEIWGSLLNGGTLHLISDSTLLDYERFKSYLREKRITTIVVTTALFNQLIDYDEEIFDSLKHLLFGGEATSELHLQKLRDRQTDLDIRNLYGPTETTTIATHYVVRDLVKKTPIGKPISNTRTYIIEDQVLCGIGVPGELCITGDGLARGYLNNPQLTEEKFVPCPYEEGRMYRSGDLVRWLPDGNIEYLGRIDEQVKIRGYRIELREIEGAFRAIKGINDCIVLLKEIHGNKTLCAYFVAEEVIEIPALRMQLADLLPQYMLPAHIMQIDSVPVTRNGKIDKRKLPDIVVNSAFEFVAPSNEVECALCKAYEDVLGLDQVGINDNFFELGGDSLKAIQVVTNMRESGYTVTVQMIMQYQIVSAISAIAQKNNIAAKKNEETLFEGEVPFGMLQSLFSVSDIYSRNHFNMSLQFELSEPVSEHAMVQAVSAVIQHHDMLRAVVEEGIQIVRGSKDMFSFEMHDLRSCEDEETSQIKIRKTLQKVQQSLNIYSGPLFRVTVFQKEKGSLLHICVHHFVSDAVSLRILAEDLLAAYHCCKQQNPIRLPMKTSSYSEWSSRFRNPNYRHLLDVDKPYWETINARVKSVALSHDHNKRKRETRIHIGEKELSGIDILAKMIYKADMNQLLTAAIVQAICELRGVEEISLFLESYGRQETGVTEGLLLDRTVGWFTNIYPLVLQRHVDFEETLHHVIEEMRKVPNSGLGYLPAMETHQFTEMAIPDIAVNYLGNQGSFHDEAQGIKLSEEGYGQDIHPQNIFLSPLSINVTLSESVLISRFLYDQSVFTPKSVQILMDRMYALLGEHIRINQKAISNAVSWTSENRTTQYIKQAVQAMDMYTKTVISNNQFQEYPLTGIQKLSYEMGARNGIVAFPFNDRINQARFSQTWNKILQTFDVLRSSVIMGNSQERIRIYDWKAVQIPYLDISDLSYADRNECLKELSLKMDCFEQEKQYCLDELASKAVLVKLTETSFLVILACSHMIFDRFSSEVLRDRLSEFYYNDSGITELSYQNYYQLLRNEKVTVSEDTIIKRFEVEEYCDTMEAFVSKNENRIFKSFLYNSSNQEKWSQVPESKQLSISQKLFTIAMRYIFPHMDIPLLTLYIARQNSFINLFEYIGEFLDVVPVCLEEGKEISIEREVQPKLTFAKENNVHFSSLFSDETCETSQYSILQDRLSKLYEKRKYILVYNNTGVLNSANDLLVSSDKYTAFYNIMSIVVKPDGIFMNLPVDAAIENNIQTYLDEELVQLIEESLHE
jgi:amino acid adenylation domain-containing protein